MHVKGVTLRNHRGSDVEGMTQEHLKLVLLGGMKSIGTGFQTACLQVE